MFRKAKDPASAFTHFLGCITAAIAAIPLLYRVSTVHADPIHFLSLGIFILSMVLLYGASTIYHTFNINPVINKRLKKMDHMMIFILIAGTYTPICTIVLPPPTGYVLVAVVWALAVVGILIKALWVTCPKWFSSVIYIAMGWLCLFHIGSIISHLSTPAFLWLLAGGIIYTIGGVIYALKLPSIHIGSREYTSHDVFHLFCLGGSFCHFILMFQYVAVM